VLADEAESGALGQVTFEQRPCHVPERTRARAEFVHKFRQRLEPTAEHVVVIIEPGVAGDDPRMRAGARFSGFELRSFDPGLLTCRQTNNAPCFGQHLAWIDPLVGVALKVAISPCVARSAIAEIARRGRANRRGDAAGVEAHSMAVVE